MKIEFSNEYKIQGKDVDCCLSLKAGLIHLIKGENGIGKTTFVSFLKLHQKRFFPKEKVRFVDQYPLAPLNSISFNELKIILAADRVEELNCFEMYEKKIEPFIHQPIKSLSGGQNQLVKIATALYLGGDFFFFDEPFQYLDSFYQETFKEILLSLKNEAKTVIIIEHNLALMADIYDEQIQVELKDKVRIYNGN